jgi:hypothetical protein
MAQGLRAALFTVIGAGLLAVLLPRPLRASLALRFKTGYGRIAAEAIRRPKLVLLLVWLVALIPMVQMTAVVRHYGVNVPTLDDWAMAPLIVKAHRGELKWADIFQQQQEARTVLPNLIFVLSARTEWNVRDQMWVSILSCWLTAAGLFVLLRRSGLRIGAVAICFWLMVLALFSPAAYELWIFASGFPSFLPGLFLVAALVLAGSRCRTVWKFVGCAALATASTFTLAHGMLLWGLSFPPLLLANRPARWARWLAAWVAIGALCAGLYFWGYEKPPSLPQFAPPIGAMEYVRFVLLFLGGGLAYSLNHRPEIPATLFALVQLLLLGVAFVQTTRRFKDRDLMIRFVPWFALALYSLASAALAALGRVEYGAAYALASRYVPFSLGLTLAVIALAALLVRDLGQGRGSLPAPRWGRIAAALLVAAYLVPYKTAATTTLYYLRGLWANDRLARGAMLFSPVIDTTAVIRRTMFPPAPDHVVRNATALDDLKLLRPRLVRSKELNRLPHEPADGTRVAGAFEAMEPSGEFYVASGWALLKTKKRPADCVVVSFELPGVPPVVGAISDVVRNRWDIARYSRPNDDLWSGWGLTLPRASIPPGATLVFWAVDAEEPKLYRLNERPIAPPP